MDLLRTWYGLNRGFFRAAYWLYKGLNSNDMVNYLVKRKDRIPADKPENLEFASLKVDRDHLSRKKPEIRRIIKL